jgi:radical SAM superfamily enzyme YgiQ (UPF0313 family)
MASKILLISTNRCDFPYPVFPLGLAMVDTALRNAGHQTRWLDCQADSEPLDQVIAAFRPDFIGMSLRNIDDVVFKRRETYFGTLISVAQVARRLTSCPIILGGSGFSLFPERLLELTGADFGVRGEGEESLVRLIATLEGKADHRCIPGLVFRQDGGTRVNQPVAMAMGADSGPPSRPVPLVDYYLRHSSMLNLQTQRGCAFECCYCTYPLLEGRLHRRRAPDAIAAEMEEMQRQGARYVFIVDSVFNSSPTHVLETCEAICRRELKLTWGCFLRPQGLTREQMQAMARAGLAHIEFGADSFCDPVLSAYGKKFTFDDIRQASELADASKIDYCHFLICGGPGETRATLEETFKRSQDLPRAVILALAGMRVYPGTPLFDAARRHDRCPAGTDLLEPHFYFTPELTPEEVMTRMRAYSASASNWIVSEPSSEYHRLAERLRRKGVVGPLWSYLALIQRVLPRAP